MKFRTRLLSIVSAAALTIAFLPVTASRAEETPLADLTLSGLIPEQQLEQNGHVALTDNFSDDLYSVEYANEDGTRTVYLLSVPAKYQTETGDVRYIDTHIERNTDEKRDDGYRWKNAAGAADLYLPENAADGVLFSFGGLQLTQTAAVTGGLQARAARVFEAKADGDRAISYTADGAGEQYAYRPTHTGYCGSVVFDSAPSGSAVSLSLAADGLTAAVDAQTGAVTLTGPTGETATVEGALLTDADGGRSLELPAPSLEAMEAGEGRCRLTYALNADFFADEELTYPVTLSYSVSVPPVVPASNGVAAYASSDDNATALPAIEDTYVNQYYPTTNYRTSTYLDIRGNTGRKCEIYVRFDLDRIKTQIRYDQVISACYSLYEYYNYPDNEAFEIELHQVKTSWSHASVTWNNKPAYYADIITYDSVIDTPFFDWGRMRYFNFMLTAQVQGWLQGLPNDGIMIKRLEEQLNSSTTYRRFASIENNTYDYLPQFTLTYTPDTASLDNVGIENNTLYYIKNKGSAVVWEPRYLTAPSSASDYVTQTSFTGASNQKWKVVSKGNGYYTLCPQNQPTKVLYTLYNSLSELCIGDSAGTEDERFKFIRNWDGSYHIVSEYNDDKKGLVSFNTRNGSTVFYDTTSVAMDFLDDWTLEKVNKGTANIFCFDENAYGDYGLNTRQYAEYMTSTDGATSLAPRYGISLRNSGYTSSIQVNKSAYNGLVAIPNSDIWIFSGHGGKSGLWFATPTANSCLLSSTAQWEGYSSKYSIDNSVLGTQAFYGMRLAMMQSCETGMNDTIGTTRYSLAGNMYHRGAHMVYAYTNISSTLSGDWLQYFWDKAEEGAMISEAIAYADDMILSNNYFQDIYRTLFNRNILGDTAMCLNPQP